MKTILTAVFRHETNRNAPGLTDFPDFINRYAVYGETAVRERLHGAREEMNAFLDYFDPLDDYRIEPILAVNASPGPVVAQAVFDDTCRRLCDAIHAAPQVDGILLCLHGAMVTEQYEDGEGELLAALRAAVGKDLPIMATLDLHANLSEKMVENATALFAYYNNPHTDSYETAMRACRCLHNTIEGRCHPVMRFSTQPLLLPITPTAHPILSLFVNKEKQLSRREHMIDVSICHGFFLSDNPYARLGVLAVSDGDAILARQTAQSLSREIFDVRHAFDKKLLSAKQAVARAISAQKFPVVLADVADNPGSGATVDSTGLLKALIDAKATDAAFAVIYDPEVVQTAIDAGVGAQITVDLGGKTAPSITGAPLRVTAYVERLSDGQFRNRDEMAQGLLMKFGNCALLKIDGIRVIVCSIRTQPWDLEIYRHIGIAPEQMKILAVKSAAHFRASFSKIAAEILEVSAPATAPSDPRDAGLTRVCRPIYPLDNL